MTDDPTQQLTPKKHQLAVGGLTLFGGGGCLMWTVVLIPLALPLALVGLVMMIASRFVQTDVIQCPACTAASIVEPAVTVIICPHCRTPIRRTEQGWLRVQ